MRRVLAGTGRSLLVLVILTAIAVALTAVGPFWAIVALFGVLAAVIITGLAVDLRRERDADKAGARVGAAEAAEDEAAA